MAGEATGAPPPGTSPPGRTSGAPAGLPRVSVIVRSYNRVPAVCALVEALLGQDYPDFEIVIVEQSTRVPPEAGARLEELARDPRVVLQRHPPLGGARARNTGVRAARGELLLFVDDDDLPEGDRWIRAHVANYDDPGCLGVSGRQKAHPDEGDAYWPMWLAYRRCQMFSPLLRMPWTYVRHTRRKVPVDAVHGTNGSIRRAAFERFGGWDEDTTIEDEASFGLRARRLMAPGEYFCFDPRPVLVRGLDVGGGLAKRFMTPGRFYERLLDFVHRIVFRYHPWRVRLLWPLYVAAVYGWTVAWIWADSQAHGTTARRAGATLALLPLVPWHAGRCLVRRLREPGKGEHFGHLVRRGAARGGANAGDRGATGVGAPERASAVTARSRRR